MQMHEHIYGLWQTEKSSTIVISLPAARQILVHVYGGNPVTLRRLRLQNMSGRRLEGHDFHIPPSLQFQCRHLRDERMTAHLQDPKRKLTTTWRMETLFISQHTDTPPSISHLHDRPR
jgi:hypothetical protein